MHVIVRHQTGIPLSYGGRACIVLNAGKEYPGTLFPARAAEAEAVRRK